MQGKRRDLSVSLMMCLPAVLIFSAFILYPLGNTIFMSFVKWKGIAGTAKTFVGWENYGRVFSSDQFWNAMANSLRFLAGGFLILMPLSFVLALIVTSKMRMLRFFKISYFMPVMLSTTAVALIWSYILNPSWGALNQALEWMGLGALARDWLATPVVNVWSVVLVNEWMYAGYNMLIFAAGLVSIPSELYEAALIDGCNEWKKLLHVTLPLCKESFKIFSILCVTGCLKVFDLIWAMTKGGPNNVSSTPAISIYIEAFTYKNFGKSSAIGVILLMLGCAISLIMNRALRREEL